MRSSFVPPRRVKIGDAASFAGTTPRAIRHYHEIGLLPEPERGSDDRRRYGYDEMIRLLWIRKMVEVGISLADIRDAVAEPAPAGAAGAGAHDVEGVLERLERSLVAREAELQRQRIALQHMRTRGSRMGLLSDVVADRLASLPEGALRQADLDDLLITEWIFGPLGAAVHAGRVVALATHPSLREESDRVDAAEEALDDSIAVDDPRVADVAAERHALESALHAVIERSGVAESDDALFESREASTCNDDDGGGHPSGRRSRGGHATRSAVDVAATMPYDFSPARVRCMQLAEQRAARDAAAS